MLDSTPRLFQFASSELSQDAFICWLLSWAKPDKAGNEALQETARSFIKALLRKHGRPGESFNSVEIRKQYKQVDVVAVLDDETAILIEDKISATAHSGQLARYRSALDEDFHEVLPIYFKTGDQSDFEHAKEKGYEPFLRKDFLKVLNGGLERGVENDIFCDYCGYLQGVERKVESFEDTPVGEWPSRAWKGFYQLLQSRLDDGSWDNVPNPSGGFMGFWWYFFSGDGCTQYLQLEDEKLCFKISVEKEEDRTPLRQKWHKKVIEASKNVAIQVERPSRFGYGEHMTVAVFPGDYRVADESGQIDIGSTVRRLRKAEDVISAAIS